MVIYLLAQYIFHHLQNCLIDFACILKVISFSITLCFIYMIFRDRGFGGLPPGGRCAIDRVAGGPE